MRGKIRLHRMIILPAVLLLALLLWSAKPAQGQEPLPEIFVTGNDVTVPPSVVLHVYGRDEQGAAMDFNARPLTVTQDGVTVPATVSGAYPAGTLTVFLIDIPTGVQEQLPAIQQAIQGFAGPGGGMQESVDAVAIYQVGETEAVQLLAPTTFYNEVQNFFGDGLSPELGSTALIDSIASLIPQVEELKPNPEMAASIVVMSDGTDVVSTQSTAQDVVTSAIEQHLPLHTIWVSSADLTQLGQEQGQAYLQEAAAGTRGLPALLDDAAGLSAIWARIAGFRDHARVSYVSEAPGGAFDVTVSLAEDPAISAAMYVEIPQNQPQVSLDIPPDSDTLTLPNLDEDVLLRMGATVSWLDGIEREITGARLRVNGQDVAEVPVDQLQDFTVEVSNFAYGPNTLELAVTDEQGLRAANLPEVITIVEGEQDIPAELQPAPELGSRVLDIFMVVVVLGVLAGLFFWLRRKGFLRLPRGRSARNTPAVTYSEAEAAASFGTPGQEQVVGGVPFQAYLEVIEALSDLPAQIDLRQSVVRLGRSPSHCDIVFRDDVTVSRQHAVMMVEGNHFRLFDENSTSGTWVNGRQVPEYGMELADGDEIHLGAVHLLYRQPYAY